MKFKVGDKVKIKDEESNCVYVVLDYADFSSLYCIISKEDNKLISGIQVVLENNLVLVKEERNMKFKVGDKVRVKSREELKKVNKDACEEFLDWANKIVTIEEIDADGDYNIKETKKFWFSDDDLLLVDFTLDDLEFGDIVTLRSGKKCLNIRDYIIDNYNGHLHKTCWNNNLKWEKNSNECDIVKVERAGKVIWERMEPEVKEMTIKEISETLGYEVKIVKEKE